MAGDPTTASSFPPERVRRVIAVALLLESLQLFRFEDPEFAIDDAWISFRIARNWLQHGVPSFNLSGPPVEGMTNLLWTLASAAWIRLAPQVDPIVAARALGACLLLATVAVLAHLSARLAAAAGEPPERAAAATSLLLVAPGWLAYHALSGLETALYGFLFAAALERLEAASRSPRAAPAWLAGAALGLLAATRPEGALAGLLLGALALLRPELRRHAAGILLPFLAAVGAVELFRWHTYGALVPNTFWAKPPDPTAGARYLASWAVFGLGGLGFASAAIAARRSRFARDVLAVSAALAAATALSGGDWMPGFRRLSLPTLGLAALAGSGLPRRGAGLLRASLGWAPVACWVGANLAFSGLGKDSSRVVTLEMTQLGQKASLTPGVERAAISDIGAFGWSFQGDVLDLYGLTDRHIAQQAGTHGRKVWDEAYFLSKLPEMVFVRSRSPVADPLVASPRVMPNERGLLSTLLTCGRYRYWNQLPLAASKKWWVLVFRRDDVELPPRLWGQPFPKDLAQLERERLAREQAPAPEGPRP